MVKIFADDANKCSPAVAQYKLLFAGRLVFIDGKLVHKDVGILNQHPNTQYPTFTRLTRFNF
jgi:hypothetical protein